MDIEGAVPRGIAAGTEPAEVAAFALAIDRAGRGVVAKLRLRDGATTALVLAARDVLGLAERLIVEGACRGWRPEPCDDPPAITDADCDLGRDLAAAGLIRARTCADGVVLAVRLEGAPDRAFRLRQGHAMALAVALVQAREEGLLGVPRPDAPPPEAPPGPTLH